MSRWTRKRSLLSFSSSRVSGKGRAEGGGAGGDFRERRLALASLKHKRPFEDSGSWKRKYH